MNSVTVLLVDDKLRVLANGSVPAIAGADGTIYAESPGLAVAARCGEATAYVAVFHPLMNMIKALPRPIRVDVGDRINLDFTDYIAQVSSTIDPLELDYQS